MTDKEVLLSKIYDDNTICYRIKFQEIRVRNQEDNLIAEWTLYTNDFWLSYNSVFRGFQEKIKSSALVSEILQNQFKRTYLLAYKA